MVIYRLPRRVSFTNPRHSICPTCKKNLTALELIPLVSWLMQKGQCACMESKVSPRYFIVELTTGILFAIIWFQQFVVSTDVMVAARNFKPENWILGIGFSLFAATLVVAIATDLAHYIIPDEVNAAMFIIGIGMNVALYAIGSPLASINGIPSSIVGALVGIGVLWGIAFLGRLLFQKDAMGHGDIKMARGIGAVLLPTAALYSFGLAVVLGAVFGIGIVLYRKIQDGKAARINQEASPEEDSSEVPYEPESLKSLLICGLGYVLCIDIIGLFIPKLYERWFGENPYAVEVIDEEEEVEHSMIPFGPYLAAGAIATMLLMPEINRLAQMYLRTMGLE